MKFAFITLGCKANQFESAALARICAEKGFEVAADGDNDADIFIINTCSVTGTGGKKSRMAIRQARRNGDNKIVAVCGCHSQIAPQEAFDAGADIVIGVDNRAEIIDMAAKLFTEKALGKGSEQSNIAFNIENKHYKFEILPACSEPGHTRALLKIEDGCDNFCTYCVIPFARGRVRSIPRQTAVDEIIRLWNEGYRETVITGIEISSYGKDTGDNLIDLICALCEAVPDMRIRLGSLEPRTITSEFCEKLSKYKNLCPHFHLALQSGCDETLRRMGRKYNTEFYYKAVEMLRTYFPLCTITTDLIVGFPGETEKEFNQTVDFIKKCRFADMHIFPFSQREGTAAARMPNKILRTVKEQRAAQAGLIAKEMRDDYLESMTGKTLSVLFESEENGVWRGHSQNYCVVCVKSDKTLKNCVKDVRIICKSGSEIWGKLHCTD